MGGRKDNFRTYSDGKDERAPAIRIKLILDCKLFTLLDSRIAAEWQSFVMPF